MKIIRAWQPTIDPRVSTRTRWQANDDDMQRGNTSGRQSVRYEGCVGLLELRGGGPSDPMNQQRPLGAGVAAWLDESDEEDLIALPRGHGRRANSGTDDQANADVDQNAAGRSSTGVTNSFGSDHATSKDSAEHIDYLRWLDENVQTCHGTRDPPVSRPVDLHDGSTSRMMESLRSGTAIITGTVGETRVRICTSCHRNVPTDDWDNHRCDGGPADGTRRPISLWEGLGLGGQEAYWHGLEEDDAADTEETCVRLQKCRGCESGAVLPGRARQ